MKNKVLKVIVKFNKDWGQSPSIGFLTGYLKSTRQTITTCVHQLAKEKKIKIEQTAPRFGIKIILK